MTPEAFIAFARSLPEPMALTDERGRVLASNAAARDFVVPLPHRHLGVRSLARRTAPARVAGGLPRRPRPAQDHRAAAPRRRARWSTCASRRPRSPTARRATRRPRCCCASARGPRGRRSRRCTSPKRATASCSRTPCHGICRCHVDGTILEGNPALAAMLGHALARVAGRRQAGRHLRGARRIPDAPQSHPPRRPRPQRRRQLAPPQRRAARGAAVGALRDRRQPGRRHRAAGRGRHRAPDARGAARAHAPRWSRSAASPAASPTTSTTC